MVWDKKKTPTNSIKQFLKKKLPTLSENANILPQYAVRTTHCAQDLCPPVAVVLVCFLSRVRVLPVLCSSAATLSPWQRCRPTRTGSPSSTAKFTGRTRSSSSLSSPPLWRRSHPSSALRYLRRRRAEAALRLERMLQLTYALIGINKSMASTGVLVGNRMPTS